MAKKLPKANNEDITEAINNMNKPLSEKSINKVAAIVGSVQPIKEGTVLKETQTTEQKSTNENPITYNVENINYNQLVASPSEWNLWNKLDPKTKAGLVNSIYEIGMLDDIIVWKVPENIKNQLIEKKDYMILAGHNRVDSNIILHNIFNMDRFLFIRAKVIETETISLAKAKKIIDASNLYSRVKSDKEIGMAYVREFKKLKEENVEWSARKIEEDLAAKNEKSRTYVREKIQLSNCIDEITDLVGLHINYKSALKLSALDKDLQYFILETYWNNSEKAHLFSNTNINKIKKTMTKEMIINLFKEPIVMDNITVTYKIPKELKGSLDNIVAQLLKVNK